MNPVEHVSWTQCMQWMSRLGLELPSEAQWENACRAGTDSPWWTGEERETLFGKINVADKSGREAGASFPTFGDWPEYEDGWVFHAPVGSFPPNPFGLHEILGNVWEWCHDGYRGYSARDQKDPVGSIEGTPSRMMRGGSFIDLYTVARSGYRKAGKVDDQRNILGLRAGRELDP
ncbi:MAG: SUMF1/EgtB/PvdO family nonheme iron enzyme [Planctomycetes bacterium]|nr:SUMF1/EgtB/PvdO family nonheme iron enzyme [Planctomycetota bacterium]